MAQSKNTLEQPNDSDFQSCDSDQSFSIVAEIEDAIRDLPTLQIKIQAIAINNYILQKRELDEKKQVEIDKIQFKIRNSCNSLIQEIYGIIDDGNILTHQDYQFILQQKHLLKQEQFLTVQKILSGENKKIEYIGEINEYWLKCFHHSDIIQEQIQPQDEQVLKFLYKIEANRNQDNTKLQVSFLFKPNKWFHNEKITKKFKIDKKGQCEKSEGDEIQWKQGMNFTVTVIKNKKKGKKSANQKVKQPSFFHFFTSISSHRYQNDPNLDEDNWQDLVEDLELQHELAIHIYQDLIPKSLQFYLGCSYSEDFLLDNAGKVNPQIAEKQEEEDDN